MRNDHLMPTPTFVLRTCLFASLLAVHVVVNPAFGQVAQGLVAYYSFDDGSGQTLAEQTGAGTAGELFNFDFADQSGWVDGIIGGALEFDGIDDFVIAPEYPLAETALSVSIWAFADDPKLWASIVKNWGNTIVGQFHLGLGPADADTLNVFITDSGGAFNAGTDPDDFLLEEWQHVAFVANPNGGTVTLYRNGEAVDEQSYDGTFTDTPNSAALGIGVKTNNAGTEADAGATCCAAYWDGKLDDLGVWTRALSETEIQQIYQLGLSGVGLLGGAPVLQAGDADRDLDFDQLDLVRVQIGAKYITGQAATWGEGDWDGAPGGSANAPPAGDGLFDQKDIIAALSAGMYLTGPYAAIARDGQSGDAQTSIVYNPATGEVAVDAPQGVQLTSINIDSVGGIFTGNPAQNLGGSFDNDADNNIFKATFGSSFGSLSFGNVAQAGLSEAFLLNDLTVVGSLAGGGALGNVDLIYVPEPPAFVLAVMALVVVCVRIGKLPSRS